MTKDYWTYRIVRRGKYLSICEVYYTNGKACGLCEATPGGDTIDELRQDLEYMCDALRLPIMDISEIGGFEKIIQEAKEVKK